MMRAYKLSQRILIALLLTCSACMAQPVYPPGPAYNYGYYTYGYNYAYPYYGNPYYGYPYGYPDYPWDFGAGYDIFGGYGHGGWRHGWHGHEGGHGGWRGGHH